MLPSIEMSTEGIYKIGGVLSKNFKSEFPKSKENTSVHEQLAGAVGYPSRVSRLQFWNRSLTGFPGANSIQCCGAAVLQYCSQGEAKEV